MKWVRREEGGRSWHELRYNGFCLEAYRDSWKAYIGHLVVGVGPALSVQQAKKHAEFFADSLSLTAFRILGQHA